MKAQLIVYKLKSDVEDSTKLIRNIKSYSSWAKVTDNCWIILTEKSSSIIRDELRDSINREANILVIEVTNQNWATFAISKEVTEWMKNNLKQ